MKEFRTLRKRQGINKNTRANGQSEVYKATRKLYQKTKETRRALRSNSAYLSKQSPIQESTNQYFQIMSSQSSQSDQSLSSLQHFSGYMSESDRSESISLLNSIPSAQYFEEQPKLEVVGMIRNNSSLMYLIDEGLGQKWVTRQALIRSSPLSLISFYEKHLSIKHQ